MSARRTILKSALSLAVAALAARARPVLAAATAKQTSLRILILGGTGFIGPHHVRYAVKRGHRVSVFNRGRRQADLPASVERLIGDRNGDLASITGRDWDAVIDLPTLLPSWIRSVGEALKGCVKHYTFISVASVYNSDSDELTEDTKLVEYSGPLDPYTQTAPGGISFNQMKVVCEQEAQRQFPKALIVRPTIILGPGEESDRLIYWMLRMQKGGEVLAPCAPLEPLQFIDVRDMAEFDIHMVERGETGAYNATGPASSWGEFLGYMRGRSAAPTKLTWVPEEWLVSQKITGADLPMWIPGRKSLGIHTVNPGKALTKGMTLRSLEASCDDVAKWNPTRPVERQQKLHAWSIEREQEVLQAWHRA